MRHTVLVYGTLRPGNSPTVLIPGLMYDLGAFPGVRLCQGPDLRSAGSHEVVCERISVDDEGLRRLDMYEGYHEDSPETSLYIRQRLTDAETGRDDFIYEYNSDMSGHSPLDVADWLEYRNQSKGSAAGLGSIKAYL